MEDTQHIEGLSDIVKSIAEKHVSEKNAQDTASQQESQQPLDNNKNSLYIRGESGNDTVDTETAHYQKVLAETFQNDPLKAVKSLTHSQKEYTKLQSSLKQYENTIGGLESVLDKNPILRQALDAAVKGESAENYLKNVLKPESGKSTTPSVDSKLDSVNLVTADETQLASIGYLDPSKKATMTALEWQAEVLKAQGNYIAKEIPKQAIAQAKAEWADEQRKLRESQDLEQVKTQNKQRFEKDFESVLKMGFDFSGVHKDVYDAAVQAAVYIRDPQNPKLIAEDAFSLAVEREARKRGVVLQNAKPLEKQTNPTNFNGRNVVSGKQQEQPKPKTPFESAIARISSEQSTVNNYNKRVFTSTKR